MTSGLFSGLKMVSERLEVVGGAVPRGTNALRFFGTSGLSTASAILISAGVGSDGSFS